MTETPSPSTASPWLPVYTARSRRENGRQYYVTATGDRWPSVSTILNATRPREQRDALNRWKQRVGVAAAQEISTTASRRGTGTHKQIERYLRGESVTCSDTVQPYWASVQPVLEELSAVRLVEGFVFHDELGYAGKTDCVASYDGVPCLCEWKTADRPKQTLDRLYDYPLQVAAYWGAVNQVYGDCGVDLRHALLAIALPNQPAELFWFDADALAHYWQLWRDRVAQFWRRGGA